jgi:acyl-CoA thioester hydrolase
MFDDYIIIETKLEHLTRAQMVYTYQVRRESDQALLATGRTQNVFTDKKSDHIVRLDKKRLEKLFAMKKRIKL